MSNVHAKGLGIEDRMARRLARRRCAPGMARSTLATILAVLAVLAALALLTWTGSAVASDEPALGSAGAPAPVERIEQPPVELLWVIRAGPALGKGALDRTLAALQPLVDIARQAGARPLLLLTGDVAEEMLARRKVSLARAVQAMGGEIGVEGALVTRLGTRAWGAVTGTGRLGPLYDGALTRRLLADQTAWVQRLSGKPVIAYASESVRCSDEAGAAALRGLALAVGNRKGLGMLYQKSRVPVPWRPAASDAPGEELKGDALSPLLEVDLGGQVGDTASEGLDGSVYRQEQEFDALLRRREREADARPWVFAFLTEASPARQAQKLEVQRFVQWLGAHTKPANAGARPARWGTPHSIITGVRAWEVRHAGDPAFSYIHQGAAPDPTALAIRQAQQDLLVTVRREIGKVRTGDGNREERWCAIELWTRVLADSRPRALARTVSREDLGKLAVRMLAPTASLDVALDDLLARLEAASR